MARQTPQQKRANAAHSKTIEKNMGRPVSTYRKKDVAKSPLSNTMLCEFCSFWCRIYLIAQSSLHDLRSRWYTGYWIHRDWGSFVVDDFESTGEVWSAVEVNTISWDSSSQEAAYDRDYGSWSQIEALLDSWFILREMEFIQAFKFARSRSRWDHMSWTE